MRVAVVVNPKARGGRDMTLAARLMAILGDRGIVVSGDEDALPRQCEDLLAREIELVAICGGDGTGQAVLTALARSYGSLPLPRITFLRGGTMNTIADNLGIRGTPETILVRLVARLDAGAALPMVSQTLLTVNDRCGFLFAAALGARFLELYYDADDPGPARAARLAVQVAMSALTGGALTQRLFRTAPVEISIDDAVVQLDARLIVAATVRDVGVGMRICSRANNVPGRFQLVASALSPMQMALHIPAVQAGTPIVATNHLDRLVSRAQLRFESEEPYTLDGDLFRAREIAIETRGTISVVRP